MTRPLEQGPTGALMVSVLYPPAIGGSAVLFAGIYPRLDGVPVTILTDARVSAGSRDFDGTAQILRRHIDTPPHIGVMTPAAVAGQARLIRALRHTCREHAIAAVHCGRALPEGLAACVSRGLGGPPYLVWAHGEDVTGAASSRELSFLARAVYGRAAAVIANSRNTRRLLMELGVVGDRIHVVHPGVDPDRFTPSVDGSLIRRRFAPNADVLLVSVGRLQRSKGHDLAIEAVASLRDELPRLHYVIAGDGPERARLESMVLRLGLGDRVSFAGAVPQDDLPVYFAAADIFVHPNRQDGDVIEGFGIVFLEAAASGKPAIGGNCGGVAEAIADGVTGHLVSGTDSSELAARIRELAAAPDRRREMGAAARARVLESFTWERAARAVEALHLEVVRGTRSAPSRFSVMQTVRPDRRPGGIQA